MRKTLIGIFLFLIIFGISVLTFIKVTKAQENTSTTFPAEMAGIAAYIKADNVTPEKLSQIPFATIEKQGKTYIYGKLKTDQPEKAPHLYIGLDGWIVAYYLKDEPPSKMLNLNIEVNEHRLYFSLNELEKAVCLAAGYVGQDCSGIKYYDFKFPGATKMSLVGEKIGYGYVWSIPSEEDFLISGFEKMEEAYYQLCYAGSITLSAHLGENKVFEKTFSTTTSECVYDKFPSEIFSLGGSPGTKITLKREGDSSAILGLVLIYR